MSDVLTLDRINASENLRSLGAVAGDKIVDNKLVRVYSEDSDNVNLGDKVTQARIDSSETLRNLGAVAGDRIVDNELISSKKDDAWAQFKYGFDKGGNIIQNAAAILEANFPLGEITIDFNGLNYVSPDELHGEGYKEATPDERREILIRERERALQEEYGQFFEEDTGSIAGGVGSFAKAIADPTTLIPLGAGYKAMAAGSGALGLGYSVTEDLATTGEVDPVKAAITTVASAVGAPALVRAGRIVGNKIASKGADKLTDKAQAIVNKQIAEGSTISDPAILLAQAGLNPAKVEAALVRTGKQLRVPASATRAEKAITEAITRDSAVSRLYSPSLDKYLGTLSTRVRNISEPVFGRLRKYEFNTHVNTQKSLGAVEPFVKGLNELPTAIKSRIGYHLYNGNVEAAEGIMKARAPALLESYTGSVKNIIAKTGKELEEAGHSIGKIDNYFPRLVKDYDGLRNSLGKAEQGTLTKAVADYAKKKGVAVANLTEAERSEVIDLALRGYRMTTDGGKPRFVKPRTIKTIAPEQMQYYASPEESLVMYLRGSIDDIEKRKFFGRTPQKGADGVTDLDDSVGRFVAAELESGAIPAGRERELTELLKSRFISGPQSGGSVSSFLRNTGYMGTIANPISALTQLSDIGLSGALKGFRNTMGAMFNTKDMRLIDLGIENTITQELGTGVSKMSTALSKMLKYTGFQAVDRLGKETLVNAAFKKASQQVKSVKGEALFRQRVGKTYGDETDSLIADLQAGNITENVKLFAFNELSDVQPISLSEMPQAYLDNPNGRILYMLKSFTLKMYDVARREVVREWKQGNKLQATKNATLLAGYLTVANTGVQATKDMLLGREVRPEDLPDRSLWALLGVFGMNKYTSERYLARGDIKGAVINTLAPATPVIEAAITLGRELPSDDPNLEPVLKGIPMVGPLLYNWFGGGAEKHNERLDK